MLKFVFWILLALNAVVFAYGRGYLGKLQGGEHEPARLHQQVAPDRLTLVPPAQALAAASAQPAAGQPGAQAAADQAVPGPAAAGSSVPASPAPGSTAPAAAAAQLVACTQVGTFGTSGARRFENRLAKLDLGQRQARIPVSAQDVTSYLVHIPPQGSKEAAERKATELRSKGVDNFFIMSGESPLKWAISLGVFKSETAAQALLASLGKQGVHSARIYPRGPQTTRFAYQFRDIDAGTRAKIAAIADAFDSAEVTDCR